MTLLNSSNTFS